MFCSLAVSDVKALHLIRQCRFLESSLNTNFTTRILSSYQDISFAHLKKEILELDFSLLLSEASNHASQQYVQAVAASPISSWPKVMDLALEKGAFGTSCSLALLRLLSLHTLSDNKCPVPNCSFIVGEDSPCTHFLADHTTLSITAKLCRNLGRLLRRDLHSRQSSEPDLQRYLKLTRTQCHFSSHLSYMQFMFTASINYMYTFILYKGHEYQIKCMHVSNIYAHAL